MEQAVHLGDVNWADVVDRLAAPGWVRLAGAVAPDACEALARAAPGPWSSLPDTEGSAGVRQAGLACHQAVEQADGAVRRLAELIGAGIDEARPAGLPSLPRFNHAEWCSADGGWKFITPHRDPDTAGGVIAVLTIHGRATFRIWDIDGPTTRARLHADRATAWTSDDGDLVLMRGGGWPLPTSVCPIHEAESPTDGDRVTLTLRHNKGGYGADYFP